MKLFKVIVNTVLLLSFIINAVSMLLATLFDLYSLMEWHVIAGWVMLGAAVIHVIMNFRVYKFHWKQLLKKK